MILGLIKSNFPGERRVALLPEDINNFENEDFDRARFWRLTGY